METSSNSDSTLMKNPNTSSECIHWGIAPCLFGKIFLSESPCGITHLSFFDGDETETLQELRRDRPAALLTRDDKFAAKLAKRIFSGEKNLPLDLVGTPFQLSVWQMLRIIPEGSLTTYGKIAAKLGMPNASRAVGGAVGANRISLLIPCHRVIRSNGELGGYRWGAERKRAMLARESESNFS